MARKPRRTALEKLQDELLEVQTSISQYEACLNTLRDKEKDVRSQIEIEELKQLKDLMNDSGITVDDLKDMLEQTISTDQNIA